MKSKLKRGIIITVLTLVGLCLIYVVYIAFFTQLKSTGKSKDMLDRIVGGKYTLMQTDQKLKYKSNSVIPIPYIDRYYELFYTDNNGKDRNISFSYSPSLFCSENENEKNLRYMLEINCRELCTEDFCSDILDKYFDGSIEYIYDSIMRRYTGDGYSIKMNCVGWMVSDGISLCDSTLSTYANCKNNFITVEMYIDKDHADKQDEYIEKIKKAMEDYEQLNETPLLDNRSRYELTVYSVDDLEKDYMKDETLYIQDHMG